MSRYVTDALEQLSEEKFVLLSGPRQVGKTTLAKAWLGEAARGLYANWDVPEDRQALLSPLGYSRLAAHPRVVLDEIHKYPRWKAWVKGLFDKHHDVLRAVVTGSARLDVYQRSGDSMLGRYEALRLHPFSVGELIRRGRAPSPPTDWLALEAVGSDKTSAASWTQLTLRSGFPEPFTKDSDLQHRRWATRRRDLVIREDLRDLSEIRHLALVEHLALLLPSRVGAPLSINALREELSVAHDTASGWLDALERLHYVFRLSPYSQRLGRSLRKEQKLYLWDWSELPDPGARFENMVASHLLKAVNYWNDVGYGEYDLRYYRDVDKHEVDFVVTESRKPVVLVEAKLSDTVPAPDLLRLGARLLVPMVQLLGQGAVDSKRGSMRVVTAHRYLSGLP